MKTALFAAWLGIFLLPALAEDWTTTDGKVYRNVQVLSHNAAYVTILYKDGGGRVPLTLLKPDLQKRFGYSPAQAPAVVAATRAADQRDKEALAQEKKRILAQNEQQLKEMDAVLSSAYFPPAPNAGAPAVPPMPSNDNSYDSESPSEIDSGDYDDGGWYDGYGYGYGYGYGHGYGRHGYGSGNHFTHGASIFSAGGRR
jgi:hypothetical protein